MLAIKQNCAGILEKNQYKLPDLAFQKVRIQQETLSFGATFINLGPLF